MADGNIPTQFERIKFGNAHTVRRFLKNQGFTKVKVKWSNNPFGGEGRFWVALTDIPAGVTLIHSSGSREETKTYADDQGVASRIAALRKVCQEQTKNVSVLH